MTTFESAGEAQILAVQGQMQIARSLADAIRRFVISYFGSSETV